MILSYLKYLLQRKTKYSIHSPFVYEFMTKVLYDKGTNRDYDLMLRISRLVDGKKFATRSRRKQARFLYRLVGYLEPETVLSFGKVSALNTSALALGNLQTKVYLEQSNDFLETLSSMGVVNVNLIHPETDKEEELERYNTGFVLYGLEDFGEDTWNNLEEGMAQADEDTVLVFEGIHHSRRTEAAWEAIKEGEGVSLTMDLYSMGLVFFREGIEKQDFVLRY
ncbi:MAG: hypothetical protein IJQ11_13915 [Bacteroidales bacterium]|nr:hypothetical protein [Bacteroidales bacterium]